TRSACRSSTRCCGAVGPRGELKGPSCKSEEAVNRLALDIDREARSQRLCVLGRGIRSHPLGQVTRKIGGPALRRSLRNLHLGELCDVGPGLIGGGDDLARFGLE